MSRKKKLAAYWVVLGMVWMLGCGTKQPTSQTKSPEPVIPQIRTCPGALVGPNTQITTAVGESNAPVVTWIEGSLAIAWWDLRGRFPDVRLVHVDRHGVSRSPDRRMPTVGASRDHSIAWDGQELHLVWLDDGRVMSARHGARQTDPVILASEGTAPAAGPWGAAVWVDKGNLFFRSDGMLSPSARSQEPPSPVVISTGGIESPQIAYNGSFYAIVWSSSVKGGREILLQRVLPDGRRMGNVVRVSSTAGVSLKPMISWAGTLFAVAWTNAAPAQENPKDRFRIFLAMVPEVGDTPTMTRQLDFGGSADQVALSATGKEFGLAWVGSRQPVGSAIYLQRIGLDGNPLEETMEVTDGVPLTCGRPSIAWTGDGYALVWHDDRAQTGSEVFFAFVECGEELPEGASSDMVPPDAGAADPAVGGDSTAQP